MVSATTRKKGHAPRSCRGWPRRPSRRLWCAARRPPSESRTDYSAPPREGARRAASESAGSRAPTNRQRDRGNPIGFREVLGLAGAHACTSWGAAAECACTKMGELWRAGNAYRPSARPDTNLAAVRRSRRATKTKSLTRGQSERTGPKGLALDFQSVLALNPPAASTRAGSARRGRCGS